MGEDTGLKPVKQLRIIPAVPEGFLSRIESWNPEAYEPSFHPESALFRSGYVNLRVFLCGVPMYASAQTLDFLHLSVGRWAIRKWRGAKLHAPRRKMPSFRIGNS